MGLKPLQKYLQNKLRVPGRMPVLAPDDRPMDHKAIKDVLQSPQTHLPLGAEGGLGLPTITNVPVKVAHDLGDLFESVAK